MKAALQLCPSDRLMVFAPHPDDETLAAGDLMQAAVAAGATVRVVFATDGDNNPWPQRWLERRWRIGVPQRARWGARRRAEAAAALATFGLDPATAACFLGWPDQGLTDLLMHDDRATDVLADELRAFSPSHVVMPVLADRHPDHSALRVLLELALLRSAVNCVRLGFIVHGEKTSSSARTLTIDPVLPRLKVRAMQAHVSQVALSRTRLLGLAAAPEQYQLSDDVHPSLETIPATLQIDCPSAVRLRPHEVLVVIVTRQETLRFRALLPRGHRLRVADARGRVLQVDRTGRGLQLTLPELTSPAMAVYVKWHRRAPRLVVFDATPWLDADALRCLPAAALDRKPLAGVT